MSRHLLTLMIVCLCAFPALADQITMKNGDRLTGKVLSADEKTVHFKSDLAGDVAVQWDAITSVESSEHLNITLKDGKRLAGTVKTQDDKFIVANPSGASDSAMKGTVAAMRNDAEQKAFDVEADKIAHPKFTYFWSGLFDSGLALTRGNSATASFTLSGKAVRETSRDKLSLYGTYIYANDDSTPPSRTIANALRAGARLDYNLNPRLFVFGFTDFETNQLQHLDLRNVIGGGFGYHLIKTNRNTLDLFGGISYDRDSFGSYTILVPPPPTIVASFTRNSAEAVIGEEFASKLSKRSTLSERFSFYPNLSHTGDYRFQFDTSLATQLKNWLSWQMTLSDRYISYPPAGLKGNDLLLSTGLRVTWGKAKL